MGRALRLRLSLLPGVGRTLRLYLRGCEYLPSRLRDAIAEGQTVWLAGVGGLDGSERMEANAGAI